MQFSRVVFDLTNAAHRCSAALAPLTTTRGERTEVIFALLRLLSSTLRLHPATDEVVVVWDGKGCKGPRRKLFPGYKIHRETDRSAEIRARIDAMYAQVNVFWEKFGVNLPITWMESQDKEADDIIAMLAHETDRSNATMLIVSGDRDLLQLVSKGVWVLSPTKGDYCNLDNFAEYTKGWPTPKAYLAGKCLMGDVSDNVPGVVGVGEVTAKRVLEQHRWKLTDVFNNPHPEFAKSKIGQKVKKSKQSVALGQKLMSLHLPEHKDPQELKKIQSKSGKLRREMLYRSLAEFQFASILSDLTGFCHPFMGL